MDYPKLLNLLWQVRMYLEAVVSCLKLNIFNHKVNQVVKDKLD